MCNSLVTQNNIQHALPAAEMQNTSIISPRTKPQQEQEQPWVAQGVSFSQYSEFAFIPKDEPSPKWYNPEEKKRFRRNLIADARRLKRELEVTPTHATTPDRLCECLGLEAFMNKDLMLSIANKRRAHIDAILSEQRRQRERGVCDLETLSKISKESSEWTATRAQKLGMAYSELPF